VVADQYHDVSVGRHCCPNKLLDRHVLYNGRSLPVAEERQTHEEPGESIVLTHIPAVLPGSIVFFCYLVNLQLFAEYIYIYGRTVIEHNITQKSYTSSSGSSSRERGGEAMAAAAVFFSYLITVCFYQVMENDRKCS